MTASDVSVATKKTVFMHVYMRSAASYALKRAELSEDGQFYAVMDALLYSAFMIEAYLNFLGEKFVKNWDLLERKLSVHEKLELVCRALKLKIDKDGQSYEAYRKVFKFRNLIAHGKSETLKASWTEAADSNPVDPPETQWEKMCNLAFAQKVVPDTKLFVKEIHQASNLPGGPFDSMATSMTVKKPI